MNRLEPSMRVLVADDDPMLREIATGMLQAAGFEVQAVCGGDAAVAACALRLPDIVLLDVEMPEGDGYQACANIRSLPAGADLPIIMVTGCDDTLSIDHAYQAGATDFVVKPINWALLVHRIRYVMRGARTIDALRLSEQKNGALLKAIPDGICLLDARGHITRCFSPIGGLAGIDLRPDAGAVRFLDLIPADSRKYATACLDAALRGDTTGFEFVSKVDGLPARHFECRYLPNPSGQILVIVRDITARKETEARIHRLAYYDELTGLPNRAGILEYLSASLAQARSLNRSVTVLYIDLDQFKRINDTLGHGTGDALLSQVAERLAAALSYLTHPESMDQPRPATKPKDLELVRGRLARLGGDEFLVVLTGAPSLKDAQYAASQILSVLTEPFRHASYEFVVTPSIGIASYPEHAHDAQSLLKNADVAMYEAKSKGRNQMSLYDRALNARALKRLSLEMQLRRAVESSKLEVHYQPKYTTHGLTLLGGEALLRWFDPERGQIPTGEFIAVAEETGLIAEIGKWALQQVCRDMNGWRAAGIKLPRIAINLSGRDFMHPDSLIRMADTVSGAQLSPSLFELELTEGVLMQDAEGGRRSLQALKEFGFTLAIDDFGTGYCSLGYLKRFPLDTLKIDRSFVADINIDADDAAIVRAIIALGHNLNLRIVAEGVETTEQLKFLADEGCDAIQGYLLSPAVPAAAFRALLQRAALGLGSETAPLDHHRHRPGERLIVQG